MRNFRLYCVDFFEIMYEAPVTICGVVAATYEYCNEFPSDYECLRLRHVEYEPERDLSKECFNFYDARSMFLYSISSSGMMHWNGFHTVYSDSKVIAVHQSTMILPQFLKKHSACI